MSLSVLLLADDRPDHANTVLDHIDALRRYSRHRVRLFNPCGVTQARLLDIDAFDAVVVHYSLVISIDHYLAPAIRAKLARYRGVKVLFRQDEYCWVDDIVAAMREIRFDVLFTAVPEHERRKLYGDIVDETEMVPTLTGYVPEELVGRPVLPLVARPLDVGYRGRDLPYWLGRLAREKAEIGRAFEPLGRAAGLAVDIAVDEDSRIYGSRWIDFLSSCKATLGTESGASIADFDGSIESRVREYLERQPETTFDEVWSAVLAPHEDNVRVAVISPRLFEAAALRTALILFPGDYSGILTPWDHYVPLEKDFSNFDEVVAALRDVDALQARVDRTYADVVGSGRYSFRTFAAAFDQVVDRRTHGRWRLRPALPLMLARREAALATAIVVPDIAAVAGASAGAIRAPFGRYRRSVRQLIDLLRSPGLRRIALVHVRRHGLTRESRRLLADLHKLALVEHVARVEGDAPVVEAVFDRDQGDIVVSVHRRVGGGGLEECLEALRSGSVRAIRVEGGELPFPVDAGGARRLLALERVARESPSVAAAALIEVTRRSSRSAG